MSCENLQLKGNLTGSHAQPQPEITLLEVGDPVLKAELANRICECVYASMYYVVLYTLCFSKKKKSH